MPSGHRYSNKVAIVGASSLRGKELKQLLEDRNFPADEILLLDETVMAGTLTEAAGEPTFVRALEEDSFEGIRFAFFAGTTFDAERNWLTAQRAGATVIDLTGAVTASGRAHVRIPALASVLPPVSGPASNGSAHPAPYYSPPTPVIAACTLAAGLLAMRPLRTTITLFPPVSERDQAGVEELESQTTNLLSFRPIEQIIFDAQVAFNLLAGYGLESKPTLSSIRSSISGDVAHYLAGRAPVPAIQLVQAAVFYGYAFSAYAEFNSPQSCESIEAAFELLGVRIDRDAPPTNVSVAGENEIHLARCEPDPGVANGVWFWGVADNVRLAATNAVRIAEDLVEKAAN